METAAAGGNIQDSRVGNSRYMGRQILFFGDEHDGVYTSWRWYQRYRRGKNRGGGMRKTAAAVDMWDKKSDRNNNLISSSHRGGFDKETIPPKGIGMW